MSQEQVKESIVEQIGYIGTIHLRNLKALDICVLAEIFTKLQPAGAADVEKLAREIAPLIDWLENEAVEIMAHATSRQESAQTMRDAKPCDLMAAKALAEKMSGHKLIGVSMTTESANADADVQERIASKLECQAKQLANWAHVLRRSLQPPQAEWVLPPFADDKLPEEGVRIQIAVLNEAENHGTGEFERFPDVAIGTMYWTEHGIYADTDLGEFANEGDDIEILGWLPLPEPPPPAKEKAT